MERDQTQPLIQRSAVNNGRNSTPIYASNLLYIAPLSSRIALSAGTNRHLVLRILYVFFTSPFAFPIFLKTAESIAGAMSLQQPAYATKIILKYLDYIFQGPTKFKSVVYRFEI